MQVGKNIDLEKYKNNYVITMYMCTKAFLWVCTFLKLVVNELKKNGGRYIYL